MVAVAPASEKLAGRTFFPIHLYLQVVAALFRFYLFIDLSACQIFQNLSASSIHSFVKHSLQILIALLPVKNTRNILTNPR